jgi:propanol-preferring alcohol dehydrogenase
MGLRVIAIDGGEEKRSLCLDTLGAEAFVDFTKVKDVAAEVIRLTDGKGAHGIFVTAGNKAAYESAPQMVRVGGRVMCIGLGELLLLMKESLTDQAIAPSGSATVGAEPGWFIFKNLHVIGTKVGSMRDTEVALDYAARVRHLLTLPSLLC